MNYEHIFIIAILWAVCVCPMAVTLEFKPDFIHYGCLCGVGSIERFFFPLVFVRPPVLHCVFTLLKSSIKPDAAHLRL